MGAWIWESTADELRDRGLDAETITLRGLNPGESSTDIAAVRLANHVQQLIKHVEEESQPVVLVSHSYSGIVTASAADRLGDQVLGLIHVGAFVPTSGRSLLDDWGDSDDGRAQERSEIEASGNLWPAPTRGGLDEAWNDAPAVAAAASRWRRKHLVSGHWPMLSAPESTVDLLDTEIRHYTSSRN